MLFGANWEKFLWEGIIFLTYLLICGGLLQPRFSKKTSLLIGGGTVLGIVLLQIGLLMSGQDTMLVLTMLPLTAYLPSILCMHILSRAGFFQTMAGWTVGIIVYFLMKTAGKLLVQSLGRLTGLPGWGCNLLIMACLLLLSGGVLFLVFRFLRRPFQIYVLRNQTNWILMSSPILMIVLLLSYVSSSTTDETLLVLLLLTACSIFLVLVRLLVSASAIARLEESEKAVAQQMEIQRREYEDLCNKMEMGRIYRHDMRHHLLVLEQLAEQSNVESVAQYISRLNGRLSETEKERYCENPTVNAVLAACIRQAKEARCSVTANVRLPNEIPFDEMDICVALANAAENAVNACRKIEKEENRYIRIQAELVDNRKLTIAVYNPCAEPVSFDADGFPLVPERKGHGIGLKSISAIARKYHGLFACSCTEGEFQFKAVLFAGPDMAAASSSVSAPRRKVRNAPKAVTSSVLFSLLVFFLAINCMPVMAQSLAGVPVLGSLVQFVNLRSHSYSWGDTAFNAVYPIMDTDKLAAYEKPPEGFRPDSAENAESQSATTSSSGTAPQETGSSTTQTTSSDDSTTPSVNTSWETQKEPQATRPLEPSRPSTSTTSSRPATAAPTQPTGIPNGIEDMDQQIESYIATMREKFLWYVARKYDGYVAMDTDYQIVRNDDRLFTVCFETTINVGGSSQYSRYLTLDKQTGSLLELESLFQPGSDYIGIISRDILRQMTEQVENGEADYFIPGGIWSEDECFQEIGADQNFYINSDSRLVIGFDEYEVAPGSMGRPEFVIPTDILQPILLQPSCIG
ncbi:MAG TPA: GHKL domain-containing protein [Firmicutes bacterium]|nr:GHKL domain-containing protein [Bacillota bacterium]